MIDPADQFHHEIPDDPARVAPPGELESDEVLYDSLDDEPVPEINHD